MRLEQGWRVQKGPDSGQKLEGALKKVQPVAGDFFFWLKAGSRVSQVANVFQFDRSQKLSILHDE